MPAALETRYEPHLGGPFVRACVLAWTSHTDGTVTLPAAVPLVGELLRAVFVPGAGGVQPTNLYDVTLEDAHGIDLLAGQGANLSNTAASHVCPGVPLRDGTTTSTRPVAVAGPLTLKVTNAGDSKQGQVILYVR